MTTFYKRSELAFRIGVFLSLGPGLSGAFGGLLAAGLLKHDYAGLVSWQRIFVLEVSFLRPARFWRLTDRFPRSYKTDR